MHRITITTKSFLTINLYAEITAISANDIAVPISFKLESVG